MARKAIPPTRSNYLRIQRSLLRTQLGHDMLERKRQILVLEMMGKVEAARLAREEIQKAMARAFEALQRAALASGMERLARESCGIPATHTLTVSTRSVMGVDIPEIVFQCGGHGLRFGLTAWASGADEVMKCFHEALQPVLRLADLENAVLRLAREVKRTQRRVNALEKVFIPSYEETLKFIGESLDEREREGLVVMKKVKRMRQEPDPHPAGEPAGLTALAGPQGGPNA